MSRRNNKRGTTRGRGLTVAATAVTPSNAWVNESAVTWVNESAQNWTDS